MACMRWRTGVLCSTSCKVACSPSPGHEDIARDLRRPIGMHISDRALLLHELVRFSTLAPSSGKGNMW
jgi:hypothetical protein